VLLGLALALALLPAPLQAARARDASASAELLTRKRVFRMPAFTTQGGATLPVRVGYETFGKLNAKGDNAIWVCHYFSGTSHCAGKYCKKDAAPGYWDAIIGPGKAIDTTKYYVVSSDVLCNVHPDDPRVITTGPATINKETGKPYGTSFPVVTVRDMVNVQKALADRLGIKKLKAVMGPSMGSMQTVEWASAYPEMVQKIIPVIPAGLAASPYLVGSLGTMGEAIRNDPRWQHGDYYGKEPPVQGTATALRMMAQLAGSPQAARPYRRAPAQAGSSPGTSLESRFAVEEGWDAAAKTSASTIDANHMLYIIKANQLFQTGHGKTLAEGVRRIKAPALFVVASSDLLLFPKYGRDAARRLRAQGTPAEVFTIKGKGGHYDGLKQIGLAADAIREFLER